MTRIVELRQYTLRPGARDTLIDLFERDFVTGQQECGIHVGGRFRDLDGPDRFVWLRSFPDMAVRPDRLAAFYDGPVWARHGPAANATMLDSDDVLLLRGPEVEVPDDAKTVVLVVCHPRDPAGFAAVFESRVRPSLTDASPLAVLRTEPAANNYPRLPVREGENVFVWCGAYQVADRAVRLPDIAEELRRPPQVLRLEPVRLQAP